MALDGTAIKAYSQRILATWTFIAIIYLIWISIAMKILDIIYEKVKIPGIEISA